LEPEDDVGSPPDATLLAFKRPLQPVKTSLLRGARSSS
jgi:hypothetical protein